MFQLILILNILVFLKVLQYLIIDFHALHFRIFKFCKLVFYSVCKHNILGFFFKFYNT